MNADDNPPNPPQKPLPLARAARSSTITAARWQAVVTRDATATTFVYAVQTTKIYCRASCPARLARRANISFFDTPAQAEAAGFRPCMRCRPETLSAASPQAQLIQRACERIQADVRDGCKPTLQKLAAEANLTPSHFHRVFKKVMGVTPGQYAAQALGGQGQNVSDGENVVPDVVQDADVSGAWGGFEIPFDDAAISWNDFDAMIAAEDEYVLGLADAQHQDLGFQQVS
ncbi:putative DNA repair and transcription factor Ada [Aspergillus clavatus NRRL 1]|uniref:DNA repair and transcription factor Ada, putative n=1 Tax=Aspergillus clavatus (strain ATCC 1007 / CBS 513.65 / DSM 816 / NCTC 3887 / NRRL 1 / QM 1276 / 107) TaxID=344612 RepID=A1C9X6_ASPCL|nr:DNA repair and transcription factor Ada, putative [Aspergillus clavatus NRRL 1]EAW12544.1 DNA repair and transcription factor Ada, putative [Aspergillus clavatus NRRL 1]